VGLGVRWCAKYQTGLAAVPERGVGWSKIGPGQWRSGGRRWDGGAGEAGPTGWGGSVDDAAFHVRVALFVMPWGGCFPACDCPGFVEFSDKEPNHNEGPQTLRRGRLRWGVCV